MRRLLCCLLLGSAFTALNPLSCAPLACADEQRQVVETFTIQNVDRQRRESDLVRFQDQWFVVTTPVKSSATKNLQLNIASSTDAALWETAVTVPAPEQCKSIESPRFSFAADGSLQLIADALLVIPNNSKAVDAPATFDSLATIAWTSSDGKEWSEPVTISDINELTGRITLGSDQSMLTLSRGCICGNAQSVSLLAGPSLAKMQSIYEETFSGFFPMGSQLFTDKENAFCLMSRSSNSAKIDMGAYLGSSKAPYRKWSWKKLDEKIGAATFVQLADGRVIGTASLFGDRPRTSVCELNLAEGKITELIELPEIKAGTETGVVSFDGHLWVSYHTTVEKVAKLQLAKVRL